MSPTTTFKDRHGHPGTVGYVLMHLLFGTAGVYGSTLTPSPSVADLLPPGATWALKGWALMFLVAAVAALVARFVGWPRVELAMIEVYGGLLALWALAVAATEPPAFMLCLALLAVTAGAWGTVRAARYRVENGIDRVERAFTRWVRTRQQPPAPPADREQGGNDAGRTVDG